MLPDSLPIASGIEARLKIAQNICPVNFHCFVSPFPRGFPTNKTSNPASNRRDLRTVFGEYAAREIWHVRFTNVSVTFACIAHRFDIGNA